MSEEMPKNDRGKTPLLQVWAIFTWGFLIPVTLGILMLASLGLMVALLYSNATDSLHLLWSAVCLICVLGFSFLFQWQQAIEAKRPNIDTRITKRMVLDAGRETYIRSKALILS